MMKDFISIIIPIYAINEEFENSLNSLIKQSYKSFEIILVTNNQNNLNQLTEKTKNYGNITNICKNFNNDASAWNIGLKYTKGDYILFFDQYSAVDEFTLEKFFLNMMDVPFDIMSINYLDKNDLFYDYNYNYLFKNLIKCYEEVIDDSNNLYESIFKISSNIKTKLFSKDFLLKHNLVFETNFPFFEELFYYQACFKSSNILLIDCNDSNLYFSVQNIVDRYLDNFKEYLILNKKLLKNFEEVPLHRYFKNIFAQVLILNVLKRYYRLTEENKNKMFNLTKKLLLYSQKDILNDVNPSFKLLFENFINSNNSGEENSLNSYFIENFKNKTKISVILPIFNNSKYISDCLESLLNQTLNDIEIICIEDRGEDESYDIIKEFAKKDGRIKLRSNEISKGFGFAKNVGLDFAVGEFILFMDCKNILPSDKLEKIYYLAKQEKVDMLVCPVISNGDFINFKNQIFDFKEIIADEKLFQFMVFSTNALYNASFLNNIDIKFNEKIKLEDSLFYTEALLNAKRVSFYYNNCYYLKNGHFNWNYNHNHIIPFFDNVFRLFKEIGIFEKYKKNLFRFKINMCNYIFNEIEEKNKKQYFNILHDDFKKFNFDHKRCLDDNMISFLETIKYNSYDENILKYYRRENEKIKDSNESLNNALKYYRRENEKIKDSNESLNNALNYYRRENEKIKDSNESLNNALNYYRRENEKIKDLNESLKQK